MEKRFITKIGALTKAIKICPAVMFAAKRTERVIGRIICLTLSIRVINWERAIGVLKGTRWAKKWFVLLRALKSQKANQRGKAKDRVKAMWAVSVKTYGKRPIKFRVKININSVTIKFLFPFMNWLPLVEQISPNIKSSKLFILFKIRFFAIYIDGGKIMRGVIITK